MIIGLTYDLRSEYLKEGFSEEETAEFDQESTVEAIEKALQELGFQTDRIGHVRNLVQRLVNGDRWDMIFNICEGMYGIGREAQVPAILDAFNLPYTFSDPLILSLTLHKGMTKRVIRDVGIPTSPFAIVCQEPDIAKVDLPYPLFVKPNAEGTGKGIDSRSKVNNFTELNEVCMSLLQRYKSGLIVETYLPGREFTVAITGTGDTSHSLGVMEVILKDSAESFAYSYINKEFCEEHVIYRLVEDSAAKESVEVALKAWRCLNCRDAGRVDIRFDSSGKANFMEVNPLAGLHPRHSDLPIICNFQGIPYIALIRMIMDSAMERK